MFNYPFTKKALQNFQVLPTSAREKLLADTWARKKSGRKFVENGLKRTFQN